ncbi:hypothetical protein [Kiloniella sp.]|uniref:hypothetical protein n=1 Tax=Kiloniella sp. TaxID=1938587 RepID=UPI003B028298
MPSLFKLLLPLFSAAFLAVTLLGSPTQAAVTNPYPKQLEEVLTKFEIDKANIRSQRTLEKQTDDDENQRVMGYDTYIRFNDCKGYLRIYQHRFGRVEKVYTKGECKIPGIKSF